MIETLVRLKSAPPHLIGQGLTLQALTEVDITSSYIDWMNDPEIVKYTEQRFHSANADNTILYINQMAESPADLFYGIYLDGMHVGTIKLGAINVRHKTADLSYNIGSLRVLEKNGFLLEGVRKAQYLCEDQRVDGLIYGKIHKTGA